MVLCKAILITGSMDTPISKQLIVVLANKMKSPLNYLPFLQQEVTELSSTRRKEGNVLFNDALNTFYLRLYGVRHMVKDHSDSERENPLQLHRLIFPIRSKGSFICIIPQTHTTAFVTPVVWHWLEREIAQWVHRMKDRSDDQFALFFKSTC